MQFKPERNHNEEDEEEKEMDENKEIDMENESSGSKTSNFNSSHLGINQLKDYRSSIASNGNNEEE